jgi:hypothetical protein
VGMKASLTSSILFALNMRLWLQMSVKGKVYMPPNFECWIKFHSIPLHLGGPEFKSGPRNWPSW